MKKLSRKFSTEETVQLYAEAIKNMPIGVHIWRQENIDDVKTFKLVESNPAGMRLNYMRRVPGGTLGKTMLEIVPSAYDTERPEIYREVIRSGKPKDLGEVPLGESVFAVKAFPLPTNCVGLTLEDITERKKAEANLRKNQERLTEVQRIAQLGNWDWDLTTDELFWLDESPRIFGLKQEYEGQGVKGTIEMFYKLVHPDDRKFVEQSVKDAFYEKKPYSIDHRIVLPDGSERTVHEKAEVTFDKTGKPTRMIGTVQDITESKRAEEALRGSENKYRTLVENVPQKIFLKDRNSVYLSCNRSYAQIRNINPEEIVGKTDYDFSPRHIAEKYRADDKRLIEKGEPETFEERAMINGREVVIETTKTSVKDSEGNVIGILGIFSDITSRKEAEDLLRESEERYRIIFQTVRVPIWENDYSELKSAIDGLKAQGVKDFRKYMDEHPEFLRKAPYMVRVVDVNDAALKNHDARSKDELGSLGKVIPAEALNSFRDEIVAIAEGKSYFEDERVNLTAKGERMDIWLRVAFPSNPSRFNRVLASHFDVTERKRAEEQIRRLSKVFTDATDPIVITDLAGRIVELNLEAEQFYGWSRGELVGQHIKTVIHPERHDQVDEMLARCRRGESIRNLEGLRRTKTGDLRHVLYSYSLVTDEAGKPSAITNFAKDITERKRAEAEKLAVMSLVASSVGHDLRNPLTAIRSAAYILRSKVGEENLKTVDLIDRNVVRTNKMVLNLVDFSTENKLSLSQADVNSLTEEVLSQSMLPENVKCTTDFGDIPSVEVDVERLNRVFGNLFSNAVQAMPSGGEIIVSTRNINKFIEIAIKDTGQGISKENKEKLFTPFYTTKAKGMGLGLINSKRTVEAHGGTMIMDSEEGKGTIVTVRLPVNQSDTYVKSRN